MFKKVEGCLKPVFFCDLKTVLSRKGLGPHDDIFGVLPSFFPHDAFSPFKKYHHEKLSNEVLLVGLMTFWVQREAGEFTLQ